MCPVLIALIVSSPRCVLPGLVLILFCQLRLLKCGSSRFVPPPKQVTKAVTPPELVVADVNSSGADVKGGGLGSLEGSWSNVFP